MATETEFSGPTSYVTKSENNSYITTHMVLCVTYTPQDKSVLRPGLRGRLIAGSSEVMLLEMWHNVTMNSRLYMTTFHGVD